MTKRTEQEVFDDLAGLCRSKGFAHAIAFICYRDNFVGYKDELKGDAFAKLFSNERLIRTEISTLIGLMARGTIDLTLPTPSVLQDYIDRAVSLLEELHEVLLRPFQEQFKEALARGEDASPFNSAEAMREPIFYGAESAYSFQYRDLGSKKYSNDEKWLVSNKGFSAQQAKDVLSAILKIQEENSLANSREMRGRSPDQWTFLPGFELVASDIVKRSGQSLTVVNSILESFSFANDGNPTFAALNEFNATNAYPILKFPDGRYILFQYVSLTEAFYDTPFYWMMNDKTYENIAAAHRGLFAEEFSSERLEKVFGRESVFRNVTIWESKGKRLGEIDVLVLFANRAIVIQAKSKKLTLLARKGNDLQLKNDFKSAIQDACDQAFLCAEQICASSAIFIDSAGNEIRIPKIKEVFPVCVTSEHYPALSFQARQFLKYNATAQIKAPLICDVFLLDVVTELLETPLRCLSYLELRALAGNHLIHSHEITVLGFHLKQNLWLGQYDLIQLHDDISSDVDVAMTVRREGIPGVRVPPGILTKLDGTVVGSFLQEIESERDAVAIELGLELLKLGSQTVEDLDFAVRKNASDAKDGKQHDVTMSLGGASSGITVHCNHLGAAEAERKLGRHCALRKYSVRANKWIGICVWPQTAKFRFGLVLDFPWERDVELDRAVAKMPEPQSPGSFRRAIKAGSGFKKKIGRNAPCPCQSGLKYKRCCLNKSPY